MLLFNLFIVQKFDLVFLNNQHGFSGFGAADMNVVAFMGGEPKPYVADNVTWANYNLFDLGLLTHLAKPIILLPVPGAHGSIILDR